MQTCFRLPWSSEAPGDKIMEKAALHKPRPVDLSPGFIMNTMKRKRTDSPEPAPSQQPQQPQQPLQPLPQQHVLKKWKAEPAEVKPTAPANPIAPVIVGAVDRAQVVDGAVNKPMRFTLESQESPTPATVEFPGTRLIAQPVAQPIAQPTKKDAAASKSSKPRKPVVKSELSANTTANTTAPAMETSLNSVQQAIEAQFNYEILLKHNELRLIEQELAKCQVSLEQLRRCSVIPYPGTEGPSEYVSDGVGFALKPANGYTAPEHPAPWGVTDGPYSRHYAKWLIPDPKFDSVPEHTLHSHGYFGSGEGRTTRGTAEFGAAGKARTSRTSTGTLKLQVLGENQPPAPKLDPLLIKRSTDGQWVRLKCEPCGHSNFSNTQGFLNHCRIKHSQVFKSHDQAAIHSGVPVDVDESGLPVSATEHPSTTVSTPAATFTVQSTAAGTVHPLIRSDPAVWAKAVHREFNKPAQVPNTPVTPAAATNFIPAPSTPHLSSLLQNRGFAGDYQGMVDSARTKIDLTTMENGDAVDDDTDSGMHTPVAATPSSHSMARLPSSHNGTPSSHSMARLPSSHSRTPSSTWSKNTKNKAASGNTRHQHVPPPVNVNGSGPGNRLHMPHSPVELSPHTVESNPGLVSDHDDDDDEDGYDARSQPDTIMDHDVVVEDASDVEGVQERTGSRNRLGGCYEKGEGSHSKH